MSHWPLASALNYMGPSWIGKTRLFKESRVNSPGQWFALFLWFFKRSQKSRCSYPRPLLPPLFLSSSFSPCLSLFLYNLLIFFSYWFQKFKCCAFYTKYTCEPNAALHFTVCALGSWAPDEWNDLPELINCDPQLASHSATKLCLFWAMHAFSWRKKYIFLIPSQLYSKL